VLNINIDGNLSSENHSGGWGFIIRDSNGEPRGAGVGHIPQAYYVLQAEGLACLSSLRWTHSWGMIKIQMEIGSQLLFQAIGGNSQDLAVNGHLFREIKYLARLNFSIFDINYCPWACNSVADALATYGAKSVTSSHIIWLEGAPEFVHVFVAIVRLV
jgi:ribonuclease HI